MCKSERCRTFSRFPEAFLGDGSGSGFGFANQLDESRGLAVAAGQTPEKKRAHIIYREPNADVIEPLSMSAHNGINTLELASPVRPAHQHPRARWPE